MWLAVGFAWSVNRKQNRRPRVELGLADRGDEGARVATSAEVRRRVDRPDPDAVRRLAADAAQGHGLTVLPEVDRPGPAGEPAVDVGRDLREIDLAERLAHEPFRPGKDDVAVGGRRHPGHPGDRARRDDRRQPVDPLRHGQRGGRPAPGVPGRREDADPLGRPGHARQGPIQGVLDQGVDRRRIVDLGQDQPERRRLDRGSNHSALAVNDGQVWLPVPFRRLAQARADPEDQVVLGLARHKEGPGRLEIGVDVVKPTDVHADQHTGGVRHEAVGTDGIHTRSATIERRGVGMDGG